jgi:hypothetical protein
MPDKTVPDKGYTQEELLACQKRNLERKLAHTRKAAAIFYGVARATKRELQNAKKAENG